MKSGLLLISLQGFHAPRLFVYSRGQAVPESIKGWKIDQSSLRMRETETRASRKRCFAEHLCHPSQPGCSDNKHCQETGKDPQASFFLLTSTNPRPKAACRCGGGMLSLFRGLPLARVREEGIFHTQVNIASLNVLVGRVLLK